MPFSYAAVACLPVRASGQHREALISLERERQSLASQCGWSSHGCPLVTLQMAVPASAPTLPAYTRETHGEKVSLGAGPAWEDDLAGGPWGSVSGTVAACLPHPRGRQLPMPNSALHSPPCTQQGGGL